MLSFCTSNFAIFFACSALAAVLIPTVVIDKGYAGGILGIPIRYYGLAAHANTLGPLAVVFMICLWRFPFDSRLINLISWALAFISLILSQSKTTIAAALVIAVFLALYRYRIRLIESSRRRGAGLFIGIIACSCFLLAAAISVTWLGADTAERWVHRLDLAISGQLTTLTGRTQIWFIAWEEFLASPWFGYGPSIWGDYYRFMIGIRTANSAHNQLLQSLSSAGILGLAGLLFYSLVLAVYAVRAAPLSGGISVALVGLMFLKRFSRSSLYLLQCHYIRFLRPLTGTSSLRRFPTSKTAFNHVKYTRTAQT